MCGWVGGGGIPVRARARVLSGDGCRASMVGTAADMGVKQRPAGSAERREGEQGGQRTEVEEAALLISEHPAACS